MVVSENDGGKVSAKSSLTGGVEASAASETLGMSGGP